MAGFMIDQLEHHFILFSIIFLIIGYLLGRILKYDGQKFLDNTSNNHESFFKQQKNKTKSTKRPIIDIDGSTHVVKINTDNLEKKYEEFGNKQTKNENISGSINKLKNLKK